jgi:hypothetical protein
MVRGQCHATVDEVDALAAADVVKAVPDMQIAVADPGRQHP